MTMNIFGRFAKNLRDSLADAGEKFLDPKRVRGYSVEKLIRLCRDLISHKGVASGIALAREVVIRYQDQDMEEKEKFFTILLEDFGPDLDMIEASAKDFISNHDAKSLSKLNKSLESDRRKLFSRMNMAPEGTMAIVKLREDLIELMPQHPEFKAIDDDLKVLLTSWFNPGFLLLTGIDWDSEASILEKIIKYEAVHHIDTWDDLKQRLVDCRRCFAYFHPALEEEPLIFVEVALTNGLAGSIQNIISEKNGLSTDADTAIFYSINNCQKGLRQIPLGNFLIKGVVNELARELPSIKTYSTLSPVPGFSEWLFKELGKEKDNMLTANDREYLRMLKDKEWHKHAELIQNLKKPLKRACAIYLLNAKRKNQPLNPVARFHFGNGAELYRINWMGNDSEYGLEESFGLMVNYLYDLKTIESNHEAYVTEGKLAASKAVRNLINKGT
jgi:malonyl-CoA decarboxylase